MALSADDLLAELELLSHNARMREMVAHGQAARGDAVLATTLGDLEGRGFYERYLAVSSCFGSRDGAHVARALGDPSRTIRALAGKLVPLVCDDDQAYRALELLSPRQRRPLARQLSKKRRTGPIDALLNHLATEGDPALTDLLPYGSAEAVNAHLETAAASGGADFWSRLARRHPELAAPALETRIARMEDEDPRLLWQVNAALPVLAETRPARALQLVQALVDKVSLQRIALDRVLRRSPAACVDLLVRSPDQGRFAFDRVVARLDTPRLIAVLEHMPETHHAVRRRFSTLSPKARAELFARFGAGWRDGDGCLEVGILRELPASLRLPEARRHLGLFSLAARPDRRLPYTGLLSWDEARGHLAPYLGSPDPDLRVAAYAALAATVRFERGRAAELLALVHDKRNEQDPVRLAMLSGLADLPPGVWRAEHLDDLGAVIRDALNAADLSAATAAAAGRLVIAQFPFHPVWAAEWLTTLAQERGAVPTDFLEARLTDAHMDRLAPILLSVLETWALREREAPLLSLAESLGRRLRRFAGLAEILRQLCYTTRSARYVDWALDLLRRHQPATFAALVPALLQSDESVATLNTVWIYLHRRGQDVLGPYLGQRAYAGRFTTGNTRIVLPFSDGFQRWTRTQRATFASTLFEITLRTPTIQDTPTILRGIDQLANIQGVPPHHLIRLAWRTDQSVRDAALCALGKLDDTTEALPALLEALDDDRARGAIYALRRALLGMPVERAIAILRAAPLERVTVAKEVARLYGDLPGPEAFAELEALEWRPLQRDVRVALLRALWGHLNRDKAWELLEAAASSPDPALARSVMRIPADRLSPQGQRRLVGLLGTLLRHLEATVRVATAERCVTLPVKDTEGILLGRLLERMRSPLPDERSACATAVFAACTERDAERIGEVVRVIMPERRALLTIVDRFTAGAYQGQTRLKPIARAILVALSEDRLTAFLQVRIAAQLLSWEEIGVLLLKLVEWGDLRGDVLSGACEALRTATYRSDASGLVGLERQLAGNANPYVRRLGLAALIGMAQSPWGWDAPRLELLRAYREDPAPLVAAIAQFTLPSEELDRPSNWYEGDRETIRPVQ